MRLQVIDDLRRGVHHYLSLYEECFFFGSYLKGATYKTDEFHQVFWNFKRSPTADPRQLYYKNRDITRVGEMIASQFAAYCEPGTLFVPVPPSRAKGHSEYDDRCLRALQEAKRCSEVDIRVADVIEQKESTPPAHQRERRPKPDELRSNYQFTDEAIQLVVASSVVIFDDLLTSGCHFRAMADEMRIANQQLKISGLFLGRRVVHPQTEAGLPSFLQ